MNQQEMLTKLMELDFISLDLGLYLNTHPNNEEAIKAYNECIVAASALRERYESAYGALCSFRSMCEDETQWNWKNNPWPWEASANPNFGKKECV